MSRANRMTDEQRTNVFDALLESDAAIQEMLETLFDLLTDEQLDGVLAKHGYTLDVEGWD